MKGDLHRSKKITTDFHKEVTSVQKKLLEADKFYKIYKQRNQ